MPLEGVEPPLTCVNMDLNHARLPIPPQRLKLGIIAAHQATSQAVEAMFVVRCQWSVVNRDHNGQRTTDNEQNKKTAATEWFGRSG